MTADPQTPETGITEPLRREIIRLAKDAAFAKTGDAADWPSFVCGTLRAALQKEPSRKQWCPVCAAMTNHGSGACPQVLLADRVKELEAAVSPITEFVRVNDRDTLARYRKNEEVIAYATGSWSKPAPITLGQLRAIAALIAPERAGEKEQKNPQ